MRKNKVITKEVESINIDFADNGFVMNFSGKDEDDNWLIVDNEVVKKAIETYCIKKFWEKRMNLKEEGAYNMYQMYGNQYEILAPKATGELMMPDYFEYQNIRNMNKFIKEDSPFSVALGALNNRELMRFGNYPRGISFPFFNFRNI
jgi:hypothetical protein